MKTQLIVKQQQIAYKSIKHRLESIGFMHVLCFPCPGEYWWKVVTGTNKKVCVGFGVTDLRCGGQCDWVFQTCDVDCARPPFGYLGSTHIGAAYGSINKITIRSNRNPKRNAATSRGYIQPSVYI